MKKILFIFIILGVLFTGCDNNEGPFEYTYQNGDMLLLSADKPAKGWVQISSYYNGASIEAYKMELDDGILDGNFSVNDFKGQPMITMEAKKINIDGFKYTYRGKLIFNGITTIEGDFKFNSMEEFFTTLDNYANGVFNIDSVYKWLLKDSIVNGTYDDGSKRFVFKNAIIQEKIVRDNSTQREEYYDEFGNPTGTWKVIYLGEYNDKYPEIQPNSTISETNYINGKEVYNKIYSYDRKGFDYLISSYEDDGTFKKSINYIVNPAYFYGVSIEIRDSNNKLTLNINKDTDGKFRLINNMYNLDLKTKHFSDVRLDINDKKLIDLIESLELEKMYPYYDYDFTKYHSNSFVGDYTIY
jgi:MORN variant repeat protein